MHKPIVWLQKSRNITNIWRRWLNIALTETTNLYFITGDHGQMFSDVKPMLWSQWTVSVMFVNVIAIQMTRQPDAFHLRVPRRERNLAEINDWGPPLHPSLWRQILTHTDVTVVVPRDVNGLRANGHHLSALILNADEQSVYVTLLLEKYCGDTMVLWLWKVIWWFDTYTGAILAIMMHHSFFKVVNLHKTWFCHEVCPKNQGFAMVLCPQKW